MRCHTGPAVRTGGSGRLRNDIAGDALRRRPGGPRGNRFAVILDRDARMSEERRRQREARRLRRARRTSAGRRARAGRPDHRQHAARSSRRRAPSRSTWSSSWRSVARPGRRSSSPAAWPSATATSSRSRSPRSISSRASASPPMPAVGPRRARPSTGAVVVRPALACRGRAATAPWAYVKVAEGCDRRCGFCAIPTFRGDQRSRPVDRGSLRRWTRSWRGGAQRARARRPGPRELRAGSTPAGRRGRRATSTRRPPSRSSTSCAALRDTVPWLRLLYLYPSGLTDTLIDAVLETRRAVLRPLAPARVAPAAAVDAAVGRGGAVPRRASIGSGARADRDLPLVVHPRVPR